MNLSRIVRAIYRYLSIERSVLILSFSAVIGVIGSSLWVLYIPSILLERGFEAYAQGVLFTLAGITALILEIPLGGLADALGYKRSLIIGNTLITLSPLALALSREPLAISITIIMFYSVGLPLSSLSWQSYIMEVSRERSAVGFGIYYSVTGVAATIGTLAGGILASLFSFNHVLLIASLFAAVTTITRLLFLEDPGRPARMSSGQAASLRSRVSGLFASYYDSLREAFRLYASSGVLRALLIVTPVRALAVLAPGGYIVILYMQEILGIDKASLGVLLAIQTVAENQLAFIYSAIASKLGPLRTIAMGWSLSSAAQASFIFMAQSMFIPIAAAYFIWTATTKAAGIAIAPLIASIARSGGKATILASIGTLGGLISLPAPLIEAILYSYDPKLPFVVSAVCSIATAIYIGLYREACPGRR